MKRKTIKLEDRLKVYSKYDGHCAYCGKKIAYREMQVDHLIPVQRERFGKYAEEEIWCIDNYMPACKRCNHYKRAHSLETFRKMLEEIPSKLYRDIYIYKVALDYGLCKTEEKEIKFYFEKYNT